MPHPCKRISSFHLIIIGLSLLINHTPKSKPQNLASRKFHKILDDHIILHKTRGGSTSAPSFSASFCSLCTWSKVVISTSLLWLIPFKEFNKRDAGHQHQDIGATLSAVESKSFGIARFAPFICAVFLRQGCPLSGPF